MKTTGFIVSTLLALGAVHSFAVEENNVVARVGEIEVHANDVQSFVDRLPAREKEALAQDPALLSQSVRMLLAQQLVLKEACAKEWDKQPDTVKLIEKARDTVVVESYLQSVSKPDDKYPSEAEVKAAYEANKAALVVPKQFKLAQIYVEASKQADGAGQDKAKARLDAVQKSIRQGNADFGALAKTQSDDKNSAANGGVIGWLAERQLQPEIRAKVVNLAKNGVSEPIRMDDGWHVIKCLDIKEARQASLDEVRDQLAQQLRAEQSRNLRQAYLAKIVRENPCSVNELAVSGILKK